MSVPQEMMRPTGWFQVGWSCDFPVAVVVARRYLGADLVFFRTADGVVHAMDAHCGHMGAHLGFGGTVVEDCVVCPFHGWSWSTEGANVSIPYHDRPNRAARMRRWTVIERNDVVYLWHDVDQGDPSWEVPDAFGLFGEDVAGCEFHEAHPGGEIRHGVRRLDPYVVLDNAADAAHFKFVHGTKGVPLVVTSEPDDHLYRVRLGFGSSWTREPQREDGERLDIVQAGVGLSYTVSGSPRNPWTAILLSTTPVDETTSELFQTVWLQVVPGDDEHGRIEVRLRGATEQLPRDIVVWENQAYLPRPAWISSEVRAFTSLRRWGAQFYEVGR